MAWPRAGGSVWHLLPSRDFRKVPHQPGFALANKTFHNILASGDRTSFFCLPVKWTFKIYFALNEGQKSHRRKKNPPVDGISNFFGPNVSRFSNVLFIHITKRRGEIDLIGHSLKEDNFLLLSRLPDSNFQMNRSLAKTR